MLRMCKSLWNTKIYKLINFICTYISDGLLYLYRVLTLYSILFIKDYYG